MLLEALFIIIIIIIIVIIIRTRALWNSGRVLVVLFLFLKLEHIFARDTEKFGTRILPSKNCDLFKVSQKAVVSQ